MDVGDLATWVGSFGTTGTIIIALIQINNERRKRLQKEDAERQERIQSQAVQVTAWISSFFDDLDLKAVVFNNSNQAIYEVIVTVVTSHGAGPRDGRDWRDNFEHRACFTMFPPGETTISVGSPGHGMGIRLALEIAFTDASGHHWVRKANGALTKIDEPAVEYYGIDRHISWIYPPENRHTGIK